MRPGSLLISDEIIANDTELFVLGSTALSQ